MKKRSLAILLAMTMVVGLAGCGKTTDNSSASTPSTPAQESAAAGTEAVQESTPAASEEAANTGAGLYPGTPDADMVTINISSEPPELNSILTTDSTSGNVLRQVISNLVKLDGDDQPVPEVAKEWTVSEDNMTYTFTLRDDMKWSNGEPVTANDFVYSWTQILTPENAAEYNYMGFVFKNGEKFYNGEAKIDEVGFKAVDDYTLEVTLENPYPYFLSMLSFYSFSPVNQKAMEDAGGIDKYAKDAATLVTNGPYKMESWTHDDNIMLVKNEEYYDAANVNIPKIKMVMIRDTNTAMNAFKAGELDMMGLNGEQRAMMDAEGQPILHYSDGSSWYFEYNITRDGIKNQKVRQALTMAIDVESYVKNVLKNDSIPAYSFTNPAVNGVSGKFSDAVGNVINHDPAEAKKLLEEGLAEEGMTVADFKPTIITDDGDTAARDTAFFQEQWKTNLGIEVSIQQMPFKSRLDRMTNKDFDIVLAGWSPDYNDAMSFLDLWLTGGGNNHTGWSNAEYDKAIADAIKETDPQKREEILVGAEKLLLTEMPIGPIYNRMRDYICSDKLVGVVRTPFQDIDMTGSKIVQ